MKPIFCFSIQLYLNLTNFRTNCFFCPKLSFIHIQFVKIIISFLLSIRICLIRTLIPEPSLRFAFRIASINHTELIVICFELGVVGKWASIRSFFFEKFMLFALGLRWHNEKARGAGTDLRIQLVWVIMKANFQSHDSHMM